MKQNNVMALSAALAFVFASQTSLAQEMPLHGVNLAGAEFDHGSFWPLVQEFDYFENRGMNVFRVPFRWERMQPSLFGALDNQQQNDLVLAVNRATANGSYVIIDPHNYARYQGQLIGSGAVPYSAFADFWSRLASLFLGNPRVIFGLMNEPNNMPTEQWRDGANAAITAIRGVGATQLILVPGNAWTGAHSWEMNWYGTPNAQVMLTINDPLDHFAFELHQYFDVDFSGTSPVCLAGHGAAQFEAVTAWLRTNQYRGFLGEFAGANNPACEQSVSSALSYLDANDDVWMGWSWWAAGPEWGEYMYTLEPSNNFMDDRPQLAWLQPYLQGSDVLFADSFEPAI